MKMEKMLNVLMLEDLEEDAWLIARTLKKENINFRHLRVDTRDEYNEALQTFKPDVVLSDHSLPSFNSIEALKLCRQKYEHIPFILVTGTVSEEFAVLCLKQGADDYILKSNLSRLPTAIQNALAFHEQFSRQQAMQEKLQKQNEELIKINSELDSFVYSVSHNIRSPLASILGLTNLAQLEGKPENNALLHYIELITKSIHKLDDTLKEILAYSRNARSEVSLEEIDIEQTIHQVFEGLNFMRGWHKIQKKIDIELGSPLYSDHYRLKVILDNLISNAIKYQDEAKPESFITVNVVVNPAKAVLKVHDNGIGIDSEYLPKIFNMFFRATQIADGSGLGLYIVKEMVEKMKGTVNLASALGEGTEITLTLPNHPPEN
jgi:signal transduction histidine kinase